MNIAIVFFFFFSSRRRHTRCSRDWSSDVCSSDLLVQGRCQVHGPGVPAEITLGQSGGAGEQVGRASCRERVSISVVAVSLKKKNKSLPRKKFLCSHITPLKPKRA